MPNSALYRGHIACIFFPLSQCSRCIGYIHAYMCDVAPLTIHQNLSLNIGPHNNPTNERLFFFFFFVIFIAFACRFGTVIWIFAVSFFFVCNPAKWPCSPHLKNEITTLCRFFILVLSTLFAYRICRKGLRALFLIATAPPMQQQIFRRNLVELQ